MKDRLKNKWENTKTKTKEHLGEWGGVYAMGGAVVAYLAYAAHLTKMANSVTVTHVVQMEDPDHDAIEE